ncbi:wax ester/triacylglycerol synthase domain-containing protein [Mycobacterium sp.]|uniref:wax ester/triacylglycerol synthase domain-containing protein n=1 Tax=Mycobacterium sp. TaxID=1785 RepID=UPI0025D38944|nr:wax ester/triacylglycerol synthase domain-containing protein [Mycobacterium sp.]
MNATNDGELQWGTTDQLNPLETLMWRADIDPMMRSTVMAVEVLDVAPDWDRLLAAHEWASRVVPRFGERVSEPLGLVGTPVWSKDAQLDLHYHLRRVRLAGDGGWSELLTLAEHQAMTPFDRARPPWEAVLVEGLPDGKAAYLLKLHHALTDGLGLTQLLSHIHSRQRAHNPSKPQPAPTPDRSVDRGEYLVRQLRRDLGAVPAAIRAGRDGVLRGLRAPAALVRDSVRYANSARRVLSPPAAPGLPLIAARGTSWRFVALDVSFADLRASAKVVGGSLNDAFLAALVGAFRLYHDRSGEPLSSDTTMPVSVPVSIRRDSDGAGGNHFAPARLACPVGMTDPASRITSIGQLMREARDEPALESGGLLVPVLARMPGPILVRVAAATTAGTDLQASNVPGVQEDMFLAGARIERIYPFAPLPGCAAMISLHTYNGVCCIGANLDAAAITDPDLFAECLTGGFAEVLDLASGAAEPRVVR